MHYGSPTAKRSKGWSNNEIVAKIDKGKLSRSERNAKTQHQLAKTTTNASGKKQWTGVKKLLKESQFRGKYNTQLQDVIFPFYLQGPHNKDLP